MSTSQSTQEVTNPVTESRFGRVYKAATQVMVMTAAAAVATLAVVALPGAWAQARGEASVSKVELARLSQCDQAVKHAATYDVAVQTGHDVETPLHAYWAAKDGCKVTVTMQASRRCGGKTMRAWLPACGCRLLLGELGLEVACVAAEVDAVDPAAVDDGPGSTGA